MRRFIKKNTRLGKPRVWEIWIEGNRVFTRQGQLDGALTQTVEEYDGCDLGKKNERPPTQVAIDKAETKVKAKVRKNYFEVDPLTNEPLEGIADSAMNFDSPTEGTRLYKPQREPTATMKERMLAGRTWFTRKLDGLNHPALIDSEGRPRLYTANFLPSHDKEVGKYTWLDRYPQIEAELMLMGLPPKTLLLGELCTSVLTNARYRDPNLGLRVDDFNHVGAVAKSLTDRAIFLQKEEGYLGYCIYDVAYWAGEYLLDCETHWDRWRRLLNILQNRGRFGFLSMPDIITFSPGNRSFILSSFDLSCLHVELPFDNPNDPIEDLIRFARNMSWEGYVVRDPDEHCDDRGISFGGTHERPASVCKLKPKREGDFIVRWDPDRGVGTWGKGRKAGGVGAVMAYLWDGEKEVEVGKVGGGLTDDDVRGFANLQLYPMVWEVEYTDWTPKGKLREPRFKRLRPDKAPHECTLDERGKK
jgi:hypothetical protein